MLMISVASYYVDMRRLCRAPALSIRYAYYYALHADAYFAYYAIQRQPRAMMMLDAALPLLLPLACYADTP